jgi:hypothetical protein
MLLNNVIGCLLRFAVSSAIVFLHHFDRMSLMLEIRATCLLVSGRCFVTGFYLLSI